MSKQIFPESTVPLGGVTYCDDKKIAPEMVVAGVWAMSIASERFSNETLVAMIYEAMLGAKS